MLLLDLADLVERGNHRLFQSGMDQIPFIRTAGQFGQDVLPECLAGQVFDFVEDGGDGVLFKPFAQPPKADVREVFQPLEIGDRDAARIELHIGND